MARSKKIAGLRFILTQRCNYNCIYCHKENLKSSNVSSDKMNKKTVRNIIREAKKRGAKTVAITGGEPFLSKNLFELLQEAKKHEQYTIINTNGSLLGICAKKIFNLIEEIHIHLPSLDSNVYNRTTKSKKSPNQILKNLLFLKESKIKIFLNIPVVRGVNELELRKIYEFGKENGFECRFLEIFPISFKMVNFYVNINEVMKKQFPEFEKISTYDYGISKYKNISGKTIYTCRCMCFDERCNECSKNHYLHLTPDMKIKPCSLSSKTIECDQNTIVKNIDCALDFLGKKQFLPTKYKKIFNLAKNTL